MPAPAAPAALAAKAGKAAEAAPAAQAALVVQAVKAVKAAITVICAGAAGAAWAVVAAVSAGVACAAWAAGTAYGQKLGLASQFGDVTVLNMKLGAAYSLNKLKGHGYSLRNLSEVPVDLVIEVVGPIEGSLRPLYEPIPDPHWVTVSPARLHLEAGGEAQGEVTIRVPKDAHWKDRNFQCALYARTLEGGFLNVGIYDKLFLSTGAGPEAMKAKGPHLAVVPPVLKLGRQQAGKVLESSSLPVRLRVRNATDSMRRVRLERTGFGDGKPGGSEPGGGAHKLVLPSEPIEVKPWETVDFPFRLELDPRARGRASFRVRAIAEGLDPAHGEIHVEVMSVPARKNGPAKKAAGAGTPHLRGRSGVP